MWSQIGDISWFSAVMFLKCLIKFPSFLQDENLVVFPDRRPASMHHYLVVTKEHIRDAKHLNGSHIQIGKCMAHSFIIRMYVGWKVSVENQNWAVRNFVYFNKGFQPPDYVLKWHKHFTYTLVSNSCASWNKKGDWNF